jgi:hypothetical protein
MAKQSMVGLASPCKIVSLLTLFLCCFTAVANDAGRASELSRQIKPDKKGLERLAQLGTEQVVFTTRLTSECRDG